MDRWLRTDEYMETITSLEMLCEQLPKVVDDFHRWKWVIISLHNALQGCMVLALMGSDSLDVRPDKHKKKWLAAYEQKNAAFPKLYLDDFSSLYKKIQMPELMEHLIDSQSFEPEGTQTDNVNMLNELRNDFIHFFPKGLSLEVSGLPAMLQDCLDIIDFLAFKCGNVLWDDESLETRAKELIEGIRLHLKMVRMGYGE